MGSVHLGVGIQARVNHDPVDEVIYYCCDIIYTPQPLLETWFILAIHVMTPILPLGLGISGSGTPIEEKEK
jgi:hypothetical protein